MAEYRTRERAELALTLRISLSGEARLTTAKVAGRELSHSLDFTPAVPLSRALTPRLIEALTGLIARQRSYAGDDGMTLPDTPPTTDASLGEAAIRAHPIEADGSHRLDIRFASFVGGPADVFASDLRFAAPTLAPTLTSRETLGVRALEDVVTPLLNMAATIRNAPGSIMQGDGPERLRAQLQAIQRHATDLEYHAGLLRRYVACCATDQTSYGHRMPTLLHAAEPAGKPPKSPR